MKRDGRCSLTDQFDRCKRRSDELHNLDRCHGRGERAKKGDRDLDHGEEAPWVAEQSLRSARTPIALLGELVNARAAHGDERDLRRNEETVQDDQEQDQAELAEHDYSFGFAGTP